MIELVIHLLKSKRDPTGGRGWYRVERDGAVIVRRTRQPLLDGARALLAAGVDPAVEVGIRRGGSSEVDLSSRVGVAARLTVAERTGGSALVFELWKARGSSAEAGHVEKFSLPAPTLAKKSKSRVRRTPRSLERDTRYPSMWRIRYTDGTLSDMVNLARAKDASGLKPDYADGYWGV